MTVHAIGPQIAVLSPPMKILASQVATKLKKSMLKPTASGIKPNTVVIAVSSTGLKRVPPDLTMISKTSALLTS